MAQAAKLTRATPPREKWSSTRHGSPLDAAEILVYVFVGFSKAITQ